MRLFICEHALPNSEDLATRAAHNQKVYRTTTLARVLDYQSSTRLLKHRKTDSGE